MARSSGNRKSRRHQLQASHQKNWLTGRYAILETLRAAVWPIDELFIASDVAAEDFAALAEIEQLAEDACVRLRYETADRIVELCHSEHNQGVAARMGEFPYRSADWLLEDQQATKGGDNRMASPSLVVICDRIQDTFNFGAILRCCDAMNVRAVVIADSEQATVTPQVSRSSAGAVNHVPIVVCDDLCAVVQQLKHLSYRVAAASEKSDGEAWTTDLTGDIALIVGSEAHGVSDKLLNLCDHKLRIPMLGKIESLNAAVAAGILLYEIRRQHLHQ